MNGETDSLVEGCHINTGSRSVAGWQWWRRERLAALLERTCITLGLRADPRAAPTRGDDDYDNWVVAYQFRRHADQIMSRSDTVVPGDQYVVAIRLYLDALQLAVQAGSSSEHGAGVDGKRSAATSGAEILSIGSANAGFPLAEPFLDEMLTSSVADCARLQAAHRKASAEKLREIAGAVLDTRASDYGRAVRQLLTRGLRIALTVVTLIAMLGLGTLLAYWWEKHTNVINGKPWRASSALGQCRPIEQGGCPTRPAIFFHTVEEANPWIEYDLGARTKFSSISVDNAKDTNPERAVPLIFEISDDQASWREIARITTDFVQWNTSFPRVAARYVRLRVPRTTYLHLSRVAVYR